MKKIWLLCLSVTIISLCVSACTSEPQSSMVKSQRRLAKYIEGENSEQNKHSQGMIDLSEGPRLKYDANFGPKNPNFEFKIVNPY